MAIMSAPADTLPDQPHALLQYRSYVAYWFARTATNGAYQMHPSSPDRDRQSHELTSAPFDRATGS